MTFDANMMSDEELLLHLLKHAADDNGFVAVTKTLDVENTLGTKRKDKILKAAIDGGYLAPTEPRYPFFGAAEFENFKLTDAGRKKVLQ